MLPDPDGLWPVGYTIQTAPTREPVDVSVATAYMAIDGSGDDAMISTLLSAERRQLEEELGRALIKQTWDAYYDRFPANYVPLLVPRPPLRSVTEIEYTDEDGSTATVSSSIYNVDTDSEPGRIQLKRNEDWPTDLLDTLAPVRVRFEAGYGDAPADVPEELKLAIQMRANAIYQERGPEAAATGNERAAADRLASRHRYWELR